MHHRAQSVPVFVLKTTVTHYQQFFLDFLYICLNFIAILVNFLYKTNPLQSFLSVGSRHWFCTRVTCSCGLCGGQKQFRGGESLTRDSASLLYAKSIAQSPKLSFRNDKLKPALPERDKRAYFITSGIGQMLCDQ